MGVEGLTSLLTAAAKSESTAAQTEIIKFSLGLHDVVYDDVEPDMEALKKACKYYCGEDWEDIQAAGIYIISPQLLFLTVTLHQ